jgi:hypothetical protein
MATQHRLIMLLTNGTQRRDWGERVAGSWRNAA